MNREGNSNNNSRRAPAPDPAVNELTAALKKSIVGKPEEAVTHEAPKYVPRFSRRATTRRKFKLGKAKFKYVPNYIKTRRKMEEPILHTITETRKKGKSIKNIIAKVKNRLNVEGKRRPFLL